MDKYHGPCSRTDFFKTSVNLKSDNEVKISRHGSSLKLFNILVFFFWSLNSGSCFVWISSLVLELWQLWLIKDLTRNPEIEKAYLWTLFNILELNWVRDAKFGMGAPRKYLLYELFRNNQHWEVKFTPYEHFI